jgi:hypothetical protein
VRCTKALCLGKGRFLYYNVGGEGFRADRAKRQGVSVRQQVVVIYIDVVYSPTAPRGCRIPRGPWPMVAGPSRPPYCSSYADFPAWLLPSPVGDRMGRARDTMR